MRDDVYRAQTPVDATFLLRSYLLGQLENQPELTLNLLQQHRNDVWVIIKSTTQFPSTTGIIPVHVTAGTVQYSYDVYLYNIFPPVDFFNGFDHMVCLQPQIIFNHFRHVCTSKEANNNVTSQVIKPLFEMMTRRVGNGHQPARFAFHTVQQSHGFANATKLFSWDVFRYSQPPAQEGAGGISRRLTAEAMDL